MLDVLLINPPLDSRSYTWEKKLGSRLPPMGLAYLAAYARGRKISCDILDAYNLNLKDNDVLRYIREKRPSYAGITATSSIVSHAARIAGKIKESFPSIVTIIGGAHVSAMPKETMRRFSAFDIGVFGEGEKTFFEIASRRKIDSISGTVFRNGNDIVVSAPREYINDLDELPFPAYDLLPGFPGFYRPTINNYLHLPVAPVISSRGCPYSCTFCDQSVFGRRWRSYSANYLLDMIKILQKRFCIREVCFYDDIFLADKRKLKNFIEKYRDAKLDIKWSCEGRIGGIDVNTLKEMKKIGCWQISFGVESGSQKILDYFNKGITVRQIQSTIRAVARAGISARAYLIAGSPLETNATLKDTSAILSALPFSDIHVSFFTPMPGSEAYRQLSGKLSSNDLDDMDMYTINYISPGLSKRELNKFMHLLYAKFYFHPKRLVRYAGMLIRYPTKALHLLGSVFDFVKLLLLKR